MPEDPWARFRVPVENFSDVKGGGSSSGPQTDPWAAFRQTTREPEKQFPTPSETAMTVLGSGARAIPGMIVGAARMGLEAPVKPFMETYRMARGELPEGYLAAHALVEGAKQTFTPAYKAATEGVGTVTPEEMERASGGAGEALAGLAVPYLPKAARAASPAAKAVGSAAGKVGITPANVGKVLKFAAVEGTGMAFGAPPGATSVAKSLIGKGAMALLRQPSVLKAGAAHIDRILSAAQRGDVKAVAESVAKVVEKNPELAEAVAETMGEAPVGRLRVPPEVEARAMEASRQRIAAYRQKHGLDKSTLPEPGRVKMPTVYSNPRTPAGKPLTSAQRNAALEELQRKAAEDAGLDIFDVFGVARPD